MSCKSFILVRHSGDSDTINTRLFWSVGNVSKKIKETEYYPLVFSEKSPADTIGYIRYADRKIYMTTNTDGQFSKETIFLDFNAGAKIWEVKTNVLRGHLRCVGIRYNQKYKESIYHFKLLDAYPTVTIMAELYVGIKTGIVKATYYTHYGYNKLDCILEN